ncbi:Gfo/Idh/MocA family oxidoreductase [Candidatus Deferrimicrobium sp.]|uniref:Gfo/Idh/MocA family protein n=1 Tax=Candidatus Deferrimicrobium sp. TaxID=3060586 RepID=UPI002ED9DC34
MSQPINVAVVGCGYWGPNLIRNFNALQECKVRYVCDKEEKRLAHMKQLYPSVEPTKDFEKIVGDKEVDAVVVATPVHLHYELAKKALQAGKHTFIEKPMTQTSEQSNELVQIAAKRKLTLMVGHTFIYSAPVRRIREIISSGDIGEIQYISSRRLNLGLFQKDINVAWDLAPHDIAIILYLLGKSPVSVNCQGKAHINKDIEDVTNMSLDFENGGFATIHSSWLDPNKVREMVIVGSKRMIVYDDNQPLEKIKIYDKRVEAPPHYDTFAEFQYSYHYGDMIAPYIKQTEPLKVETQHFLDCIKTGKTPESSGVDGLRVIQILEASSRSLKNGGARVEIDRNLGAVSAQT